MQSQVLHRIEMKNIAKEAKRKEADLLSSVHITSNISNRKDTRANLVKQVKK